MSGFVTESLRSDEHFDISAKNGDQGQWFENSSDVRANRTLTMDESNEPDPQMDISAGQKMLSAVSGSLLTSLLGKCLFAYTAIHPLIHAFSVTPLDVVRVRLQSQPSPSPTPIRTSPSPPIPFTNLPPNLGVTACCREVFWVNNTSSVCMAASPSAILSNSETAAADCAVDEARRKTFNSTLDGLQKIARNEGVSSLWRGLSPTLVMAIPANVIYFTGYDYLRAHSGSPIYKFVPDTYAPLIAGSIARVAAAAVISPIEMFRTRLQATTSSSHGTGAFSETFVGLRKMVHSQGYTSLWRGLTLTMWRDVPFSGIYWWGYEAIRNSLTDLRDRSSSRNSENHTSTFVDSFVGGAASGAVASVVTTPFDVGKTRRQVLEHSDDAPKQTSDGGKRVLRPEERSMPRFLYHIWCEEGAAGLFKGWAARCLKVAPACAIMISSYEVGKKMARRMNERKAEEAAVAA